MPLPPGNEPSNSSLPTLSIDFRSGSVVMQHGSHVWHGTLPLTSADMSQINTPSLVCQLQKPISEKSPGREG